MYQDLLTGLDEPVPAEPTAVELLQAGGPGALSDYLALHPEQTARIQNEMRSVTGLLGATSPRSGQYRATATGSGGERDAGAEMDAVWTTMES